MNKRLPRSVYICTILTFAFLPYIGVEAQPKYYGKPEEVILKVIRANDTEWLEGLLNEDPSLVNGKNPNEEWALIRPAPTPLCEAVYYENWDFVDFLIEKGARVNDVCKQTLTGGGRSTALHIAVCTGNIDIINLLIDKGANPNIQFPIINQRAQTRRPARNPYASHSKEEPQDELLTSEAPIHILGHKTSAGTTHTPDKAVEIAKLLIEHGADLNLYATHYSSGNTPLSDLPRGDKFINLTRLYLENGADPNLPDKKDGKTPLHKAVQFSTVDVVRLLLEHGARTDVKDDEGKTPLDYASSEMAQVLLDHGAM